MHLVESFLRMEWFAIKNVYKVRGTCSGNNIFEAKMICFEAKSLGLTHKKADE